MICKKQFSFILLANFPLQLYLSSIINLPIPVYHTCSYYLFKINRTIHSLSRPWILGPRWNFTIPHEYVMNDYFSHIFTWKTIFDNFLLWCLKVLFQFIPPHATNSANEEESIRISKYFQWKYEWIVVN